MGVSRLLISQRKCHLLLELSPRPKAGANDNKAGTCQALPPPALEMSCHQPARHPVREGQRRCGTGVQAEAACEA